MTHHTGLNLLKALHGICDGQDEDFILIVSPDVYKKLHGDFENLLRIPDHITGGLGWMALLNDRKVYLKVAESTKTTFLFVPKDDFYSWKKEETNPRIIIPNA